MANQIYFGDNLPILVGLPDACVDLIYIDPPFNSGREQRLTRLATVSSDTRDRTGFGGRRYESVTMGSASFADCFDDDLAFLEPRLRQAHRLLAPTRHAPLPRRPSGDPLLPGTARNLWLG